MGLRKPKRQEIEQPYASAVHAYIDAVEALRRAQAELENEITSLGYTLQQSDRFAELVFGLDSSPLTYEKGGLSEPALWKKKLSAAKTSVDNILAAHDANVSGLYGVT